jgi:hypothetical protein
MNVEIRPANRCPDQIEGEPRQGAAPPPVEERNGQHRTI